MARTDEGSIRDALSHIIEAIRLTNDRLPDQSNKELDEAQKHADAIRVKGDSRRKPKTLAEVFTEERTG